MRRERLATRELVTALLSMFSVFLLLGTLGLGLLASWNRVDPNLHGMIAFLAGILAIGIHIRRGGGFDFLAVVLLVLAVGLGIMTSGEGIRSAMHPWTAGVAVAVSTGTQVSNILKLSG